VRARHRASGHPGNGKANEVIYHRHFATFAEARTAIFNYIETFYNRTRLHPPLLISAQSPFNPN
jgi:hypothetical protein